MQRQVSDPQRWRHAARKGRVWARGVHDGARSLLRHGGPCCSKPLRTRNTPGRRQAGGQPPCAAAGRAPRTQRHAAKEPPTKTSASGFAAAYSHPRHSHPRHAWHAHGCHTATSAWRGARNLEIECLAGWAHLFQGCNAAFHNATNQSSRRRGARQRRCMLRTYRLPRPLERGAGASGGEHLGSAGKGDSIRVRSICTAELTATAGDWQRRGITQKMNRSGLDGCIAVGWSPQAPFPQATGWRPPRLASRLAGLLESGGHPVAVTGRPVTRPGM